MRTKILLADDHQMVRSGLRKLLESQPDFDVVAEASDGRTAVELAATLAPDVVVMDVSMPGLNGIEAARQIARHDGNTKVIALSGHSDRRFVWEMFTAAASGYVLKDSAFDELATALRSVLAGKTYVSPGVMGAPTDDNGGPVGAASFSSTFTALSPREREVLQLLAEGKATKQVATCLHVSVKTVETHRRNLMEKLGIYSVAELTKFAIRQGLTTVDV